MPNKHQYGQLLKRANALADAWKMWLEGDKLQHWSNGSLDKLRGLGMKVTAEVLARKLVS